VLIRGCFYMPRNNLVILIGYRGTGKTVVAERLARLLGWSWVDGDILLESRAGCTICEVFANEGEAGFRARETSLLKELCALENRVVATGGGAVLDPDNRELMKCSGRIVWLTADAETIHQRVLGDDTSSTRRPPLTTGGIAEIRQLLAQREPHYRACAGLSVDTSRRTPDEVAAYIFEWLGA
jgi:shikimate kinase